jgi:hypothetical protein
LIFLPKIHKLSVIRRKTMNRSNPGIFFKMTEQDSSRPRSKGKRETEEPSQIARAEEDVTSCLDETKRKMGRFQESSVIPERVSRFWSL